MSGKMASALRLMGALVMTATVAQEAQAGPGGEVPLRAAVEAQRIQGLVASSAGDESSALYGLPASLARAALVLDLDLSGATFGSAQADGAVPLTVPIVFSAGSAFGEKLLAAGKALGASDKGSRAVCFSGLGGAAGTVKLSEAGEAAMLAALGVSGIDPVRMLEAQVDGRVLLLSGQRLGVPLFEGIRALSDAGSKAVRVGLSPMPDWQPVRLSVTTTGGQRVTIPVELDGANRQLQIAPETRWTLDSKPTSAAFDSASPGHVQLLAALMGSGRLELTDLVRADDYPALVSDASPKTERSFHLLGGDGAWLGGAEVDFQARMTVRRATGECSVVVAFEPSGSDVAHFAPQSIETWSRLRAAKLVDPGLTVAVRGYLTPPSCGSSGGGLSAEEFDRIRQPSGAKVAPASGFTPVD